MSNTNINKEFINSHPGRIANHTDIKTRGKAAGLSIDCRNLDLDIFSPADGVNMQSKRKIYLILYIGSKKHKLNPCDTYG